MSTDTVITFNGGSSTLKLGLFDVSKGKAQRVAKAIVDFRETPLELEISGETLAISVRLQAGNDDLSSLLQEVFAALAKNLEMGDVTAVAHRVVHGGDRFSSAARIDNDSLAAIEQLAIFAPLHQPQNLKLIRAIQSLRPDLPQYASFDTCFHHSNDDIVRRFAIPRALHDEGIKRYGFHGLSYKFIASKLGRIDPISGQGKVVAAHLGSGASLCAFENGCSVDTSMGFSTLDGVPMATRSGALDPGVILHLLEQRQMTAPDISELLYHRSGLLGVSGLSADTRDLIDSDLPEACDAVSLFVLRIAGEIARLATTMGGLDAIVFTAGIGEHQPRIRHAVALRLMWLGVDIDQKANETNSSVISSPASRIKVFVIPTDEEQVIADEASALLDRQPMEEMI